MSKPQDLISSLAGALSQLVTQVPAAEQRLEEDQRRRCVVFAKVLELGLGTGWQDLARSLAPAPVVIAQVDIELGFVLSHTVTRGWNIDVPSFAWIARYPSEDTKRQ